MHGKNNSICIAGKNQCAIDAISYTIKKYNKNYNILALPNKSDDGFDKWQKSFRRYCKKKKIKIVNLKDLYRIKNLYFFSLEYELIIKPDNFKTSNLYNFHFSLLPKYRGCHTNFLQIMNGEKKTGVTLHLIDIGIDTGNIIDKISYKIKINDTAYDNYCRLLKNSFVLFKKNIKKILTHKYISKKQNKKISTYYSRNSVNYKKLIKIKKISNNKITHDKIRSLIFPPYQLPIYNGKKIKKSIYKKNKIKLILLK